MHLRAEQLHAKDVGSLPLDITRAHEDGAGQAETRRDGRGRHAMLARARLGDDAGLAHPLGEQDLADAVVDLVRAGVVQFLALEIDLRPLALGGAVAQHLGHTLGIIHRARAPDIMGHQAVELGLECRINLRCAVFAFQVEDQRHQGLGDVAAAIVTEMAALVGLGAEGVGGVHLVSLGRCVAKPANDPVTDLSQRL